MLNQLSEQNTQHEYIESRDRQQLGFGYIVNAQAQAQAFQK